MTNDDLQSLQGRLSAYRSQTFHLLPQNRVSSLEEAIKFIDEVGIAFFWPCKGTTLPTLWNANAGDRPVPDDHDDPSHVTWEWKDVSLGKKVWYYARVLRKRNTLISLELAPYFYSLTENYGNYEEDYLIQYEQGRMTLEAKLLYEALLKEGPLETISLRKKAHLTGLSSNSPFNNALNYLMADFKILPVGVSDAGSWHYSHIFDITARFFPEIVEQARFIQEPQARRKIAETYFTAVGAAQASDLIKLFGWPPDQISQTLNKLVEKVTIQGGVSLPTGGDNWFVLTQLAQVT